MHTFGPARARARKLAWSHACARMHSGTCTQRTVACTRAPARVCRTTPGEVLFFNGDQVRHRVTPMGGRKEGDELRIMLSLEYVTTQEANPFW